MPSPWVRDAGRPRRVAGALVEAGAVVLAVLLALVWCDVLAGNVVPVLQALTPVWLVGAAVVVVLAMALRTRAAVIALVPLLAASVGAGALLLHRPSVPASVADAAGQRHLRVLSLNCELGQAETSSVLHAVDVARPDVIVLPEMTAAKLRELDDAGLAHTFPHRSSDMIDDAGRGTVILSRLPLRTLDADAKLGPYDLQMPIVSVSAPGADVVIHGVHTYPPLRDGVAQWRPQLLALGQWQRSQPAAHLVVAGDFNASTAHPSFRRLADGLVDALPAVSGSLAPTWPHGASAPAFAQIDHVLTRGFVPVDAGTVTVAGTDHAGVWTDLRY